METLIVDKWGDLPSMVDPGFQFLNSNEQTACHSRPGIPWETLLRLLPGSSRRCVGAAGGILGVCAESGHCAAVALGLPGFNRCWSCSPDRQAGGTDRLRPAAAGCTAGAQDRAAGEAARSHALCATGSVAGDRCPVNHRVERRPAGGDGLSPAKAGRGAADRSAIASPLIPPPFPPLPWNWRRCIFTTNWHRPVGSCGQAWASLAAPGPTRKAAQRRQRRRGGCVLGRRRQRHDRELRRR